MTVIRFSRCKDVCEEIHEIFCKNVVQNLFNSPHFHLNMVKEDLGSSLNKVQMQVASIYFFCYANQMFFLPLPLVSYLVSLRKIPQFHLILWCGEFAIRPKLCGNSAFPQNFHTRKVGEITVFFVVRPGMTLEVRTRRTSGFA